MTNEVRRRISVITKNTTITDDDFGGWLVVNTGTANIQVDGITLQPGERLNFLDCVPYNFKWRSPIQIVISGSGGVATLTQLMFFYEDNPGTVV